MIKKVCRPYAGNQRDETGCKIIQNSLPANIFRGYNIKIMAFRVSTISLYCFTRPER